MRNFFILAGVSIFWAIYVPAGLAQTNIWNGPTTNFNRPNGSTGPADTIVPGKVVLARGINEVLFNTAAGESYPPGAASPKDVGFAFVNGRDITTAPSFSYQSMFSLRNGSLASVILNKPMVMKLTNENIYIPVMFTTWNSGFQGGFAYTRGIGPAAVAPTVSITNPSAGATFAAPANVKLAANASVSGGAVTNVEYFAGTTSLGHATASPFNVTGSLPTAGPYSLTAVATAGGISATSTAVNVTVVTPIAASLSSPKISNGQFSFTYSANPGLSYVVERSPNLSTWTSMVTNTPVSSPVTYSETFNSTASNFYRVGRLPNP